MEQFQFKFSDILRVRSYSFSLRRIGLHLVGLLLAYLIYEILVYLSLVFVGSTELNQFWNSYGILPIPPFNTVGLDPLTIKAMWFGIIVFTSIFYLVSTMASKVTIEQFRGDLFFSVRNSLKFIRKKWLTVIGSFLGILIFILLLTLIPVIVGFLGRIPYIGKSLLTISSIFTPVAFFIGLLIVFGISVLIASLFFVPAVVATTEADAFETIYQLFSMVWNQPWRLIGYSSLLLFLKLLLFPIWAVFCISGFLIVLLLTHSLHPNYIQESLGLANKWLGGTLQKTAGLFSLEDTSIMGINTTFQQQSVTFSTIICAIFLTLTLIFVVCGIVAFLFSLASVGTTLIYAILRRRLDGQNLIQLVGADGEGLPSPMHIGDE